MVSFGFRLLADATCAHVATLGVGTSLPSDPPLVEVSGTSACPTAVRPSGLSEPSLESPSAPGCVESHCRPNSSAASETPVPGIRKHGTR